MNKIKIVGYGTYLPENTVKFENQTRYRSAGETQIDMAVSACNAALEKANFKISDLDLILFASAVPAQLIPATAVLIHERIAKGTDIPAFDVNSSCTSFITALEIASNYIELNKYKNVLIVSCDISSAGLNDEQRESFELFSDGAAAVVVSKCEENKGVAASIQKTFSQGSHSTEIRGGGTLLPGYKYDTSKKADYLFDMKGMKILSETIKRLPKVFEEFLIENSLSIGDIDLIIPHQASKALSLMIEKLGLPKEKCVNWVNLYGNMVSVSVPFILCKLLESGEIKRGSKVVLCGTAAGLTINIMLLQF